MALDFPTSPSDGDLFASSNVTYVYSEAKDIWYTKSNVNTVTLTTTNVDEGENLYFTNARVYANVSPLLYTDEDAYANIQPLLYTDADAYANIQPLLYTDADAYANISPIISALPSQETTYTAKQTFSGSATNVSAEFKNLVEDGTVSATAASGTINFDVLSQSVLYYTSNASSSFIINVRGSSGTTLNSLLDVGDSISVAFLATNGSTAYYLTNIQVDGSNVTPKWQGGTAPTEGNTDSIDAYSITVIKTAATPTYTVLASQSQFA